MAYKESFQINGEQIVQKVKDLIKEGNVTKITISDKQDKELMSFPVNFGLVGLVLAPLLAAVGAFAALVSECKITVERKIPDEEDSQSAHKG